MAISLSVHFSPPFNEVTKKSNDKIKLDKSLTLKELIEHFKFVYGDQFKDLIFDKKKNGAVSSFVAIIINGRNYRHDKFFEIPLKDGDDVSFLYEYFGG